MFGTEDHPEPKKDAALLSWIQQFAPYGIVTLDTSFCVQSWNHWMEIHSHLKMEDVLGKDLFTLFPDLRERNLVSTFERALIGESSVLSTALHHYLLALPSPMPEIGGVHMRQTARIAPLFSDRAICGVLVLIEDVTQREIQAEALNRQYRRQEVLSWALAHFLKSEQPWKAMRQLFFKIAEHLDFDTFFLYRRDDETDDLRLYTFGGLPPDLEKELANYPIFSEVAKSREATVLNSVQSRPEPECAALKKAHVSAAVVSPLFVNDRLLGLLCFATCSRDHIAKEESDLIMTIAQYLAVAVDREKTNQQLQKVREQLLHHVLHLEKKVEERTSRLLDTISELETFSYTLAHDLKAPVRGMIGYCDVLLEDFEAELPLAAKLLIQKLARIPRRMEVLIGNLLEFNKVSRQEVVLGRIEMEPLIENLLALRPLAVRQAITLRPPLHPVVGHKDLLQQVLSNLVDNAIKFVHPQSKPKITIFTEIVSRHSPSTRPGALLFSSMESAQVEKTAELSDITSKYIRLWVVDEGIGVPAELHQKIFGIFERGLVGEIYEGTGMGLAIVARAMQRMRGTFGVESEPGKGSRFWIELAPA